MKTFLFVFSAAVLMAGSASAMTYYLSGDLGISGFERLCRYSNGKTYSFRSTQMCPTSIEEQGVTTNNATGFKRGEYQDGLTKVCVYDVLGNQRALRLNSYELCPLSYQF